MGNCNKKNYIGEHVPKTLADVCADFQYWFTAGPGPEWFIIADAQFRAAFRKFPKALDKLKSPPPEPPFTIDCAEIEDTDDLQLRRDPLVRAASFWAQDVTKAVQVIHKEAPRACTRPLDRRFADLKSAILLVSAFPDPDGTIPNKPGRVCRRYTRWARDFDYWGWTLSRWENDIYACLKPLSLVPKRRRQITRPPWPPWPGFQDDESDHEI